MSDTKFYIDGVETDWRAVVRMARRDYGYEDDFYRTSVACRILRENGHRVSDQPDPMEIQP